MRGFRRFVKSRIEERLRIILPCFERQKFTDVPSVVSYVFHPRDELYLHIVPRVNSSALSFTVDICLMKTDRSPIWARVGTSKDCANNDGLSFAISHLWSHHDSSWVLAVEEEDFWNDGQIRMRPEQLDAWIANHRELYPDALDVNQRLVWPLIDDLIEKIVQYAIPYFREAATERGVELNIEIRSECS